MSIFSKMMGDRKRSKEIKKKMNKSEVKSAADTLRLGEIESDISHKKGVKNTAMTSRKVERTARKLEQTHNLSHSDATLLAKKQMGVSNTLSLSKDDAEFMAKRELKKEKRSKAIHDVSSALGSAINTIAIEADVHPTKQKGSGNKRSGRQNNYDPLASVLDGFGMGGPVQQAPSRKTVDNANKGKGGKKKKGKSKPKESKKNASDPLGMPELDIPGFNF